MFYLKSRSQDLLKNPLMLTLKEKDFADFLKANSHLPQAEQLTNIRNRIKMLGTGVNRQVYSGFNNHAVASDSLGYQYSTFDRQTKSFGDALLSFVPGTSQFSTRITLANKVKALEDELKRAVPLVYKIAKTKEFSEQYANNSKDSNSKVIHELLTAHPRLNKKWRRNNTIVATFSEIDDQSNNAPIKKASPSKYVPFDPKLGNWTKMTRIPTFEKAPETEKTLLDANKNLEKEFNERTEQLFTKTYETYQNRLSYYYQKYKNGEYATYINSCNQKKAEIDKLYEPKAKSARTTLILGAIFSPLVLPLIAVGIGWWSLRKVNAKKAEKLAEYHTTLSQDKWEAQHNDKLQSFADWRATNAYSKEEFILPTNETEEAQQAHKTYNEMKSKYSKAIDGNFKLAFNFKGRGIGAPESLIDLKAKIVSSLLPINKIINGDSSTQIAPNNALHLAVTS